jgi:hypothetical protein
VTTTSLVIGPQGGDNESDVSSGDEVRDNNVGQKKPANKETTIKNKKACIHQNKRQQDGIQKGTTNTDESYIETKKIPKPSWEMIFAQGASLLNSRIPSCASLQTHRHSSAP